MTTSVDTLRERLTRERSLELTIVVHARAKRNAIKGEREDGVWKIDLAAVPERGKANEALREFLTEEFGVSPANVELVSGQTSRTKRVRITGARL